jgi:hypothetical protein
MLARHNRRLILLFRFVILLNVLRIYLNFVYIAFNPLPSFRLLVYNKTSRLISIVLTGYLKMLVLMNAK